MSRSRFTYAVVTLAVAVGVLIVSGCSSDRRPTPPTPTPGSEVVGRLVSLKDDRPVDGGIELTLETAPGVREMVRVPSIFIPGPRDAIQAMHEVVDGSKVGDRLLARGTRDQDGVLRAETLVRLPR